MRLPDDNVNRLPLPGNRTRPGEVFVSAMWCLSKPPPEAGTELNRVEFLPTLHEGGEVVRPWLLAAALAISLLRSRLFLPLALARAGLTRTGARLCLRELRFPHEPTNA